MQPGDTVYFRTVTDVRLKKGEIVEQIGENWIVKGTRTATKSTRPLITVPADMIVTDHIPPGQRVRKLESGHGSGLCIPAAESIRRQQISTERLGMTETQILQARALLEIRRRAVRSLATLNSIVPHSEDFEFQELNSEYIVAQLTSLRATAATATDADIREFKRYLDGEATDSRMMMTITRTSRTAAIRFLKHRQEYYRFHVDIADFENRLAA
jgi:hypothetical protein